MIDDRGYVAQALFDRLASERTAFRILGDSRGYPERAPAEVELVVERADLERMPRALARYAQAYDLQLVHLAPVDCHAWRGIFAWSDEVGRPSFLAVRVCSDYCRGPRRYLRAEELLDGAPEALFAHALVAAVEDQALGAEEGAWLSSLWHDDPRGAIERIARFWPRTATIRLIAQAAKHGDWAPVRAGLPLLRRALRRAILPEPGDAAARLAVAARRLAQPVGAAVAFMGRESALRSAVLADVARDLAPLGLTLFEAGSNAPRAQLRIVFDSQSAESPSDTVFVETARGPAAAAAEVERAILRWLECRVERRYPDAVVGENPLAARVLQFAARHRIPGVQLLFNCAIRCRLSSPLLMPYPFGIVIERGARIGSRVTVMHQVSLLGGPTIEDNVTIGPGAKVLGAVRVGRGATIGPNAVITQDVPSHETVVVERRRPGSPVVVTT